MLLFKKGPTQILLGLVIFLLLPLHSEETKEYKEDLAVSKDSTATHRSPVGLGHIIVPIIFKAIVDLIVSQIESEGGAKFKSVREEIDQQTRIYTQRQQDAAAAWAASNKAEPTRGFLEKTPDVTAASNDILDEKLYSSRDMKQILEELIEYMLLTAAISKEELVNSFLNEYLQRAASAKKSRHELRGSNIAEIELTESENEAFSGCQGLCGDDEWLTPE